MATLHPSARKYSVSFLPMPLVPPVMMPVSVCIFIAIDREVNFDKVNGFAKPPLSDEFL